MTDKIANSKGEQNWVPMMDDEVSLASLAAQIRKSWKVIAVTVPICLLVSVLVTFVTPKIYKADARIVPIETQDGTPSGGTFSALISLGSANSIPRSFNYFLDIMHSGRLGNEVLSRPDLTQRLLSPAWRFDLNSANWVRTQPPGLGLRIKLAVYKMFKIPFNNSVNADTIQNQLKNRLQYEFEDKSDVVEVSMSASDPQTASYLLSNLINLSDSLLKQEKKAQLNQELNYLTERIGLVNVVEQKLALTDLISSDEKKLVLLQSDAPYSMRILDPSMVPVAPTSPEPFVNLVVGLLGGLLIGLIIALLGYKPAYSARL